MRLGLNFGNPRLASDERFFAETIAALANITVENNRDFIRREGAPPLYQSGVIYRNDNLGGEGELDFLDDIPVILDRGWGDCLHLVCWRVAELLELGHRANVAVEFPVRPDPDDHRIFHVLVRRKRGTLECPSTLLGMPPWQLHSSQLP